MIMPKNNTRQKVAVHFGAGNIGRGFIGPLLSQSGFHVVFVDVQDKIIDELNKQPQYTVHILDKEEETETIENTSATKTTDPTAVDAIAQAEILTTSVGAVVLEKITPVIAQGLQKRREEGKDLTVVACENMLNATSKLEEFVREHLKDDPQTTSYIDSHVGFANCEVDRIVPPFEGENVLDVGVEGFYEWVVDRKNVKGDLKIKGMQLKENLDPFLERKLYTLNCGHAMLAYVGYARGFKTVGDAIHDEDVRSIALGALKESGAALVKKHGFDGGEHEKYIERMMERYANPNVHDELSRVSRNPLRKLSPNERLVGAVNMCREYGTLPHRNLLKGIAAAFYFDVPDDEEAVELMKLVKEKGIESAITETTKFEKGTEDFRTVLADYEEIGKWRK